ncbi:hypothetical protein [Natronobeatus ordinarius]|uniref:hypothetical protein n=1 Tax=Natronobeatus ordinarius TaxID=2963433 RepID=UPI0020CC09CE|nr:hypothetical protein [Natronobeatus ordinarius]
MPTTDAATRTLTLSRTDSIHEAPRIRHVDELSDAARERFYGLLESGSSAPAVGDAAFSDGEVIVFTDFYRVDLA